MSDPTNPDWLDRDPTAGHELCRGCGRGYVPIGTLCGDCTLKARIAELRSLYSADEAEVRATVELEYLYRREGAMYWQEVVLPATSLKARHVASESIPGYLASKELRVWVVEATTGAKVDSWLVVGPGPWQIPPAQASIESALDYYRMTQRYDSDGWPLDMRTGKRQEKRREKR